MTARHSHIGFIAVLVALAGLLGAAVATAPKVAIGITAALVVISALSYGPQTVVVLVAAAFPVIPSNLDIAGFSTLYPQRLLIGLIVAVAVADSSLWAKHQWRVALLRRPLRFFLVFLAVGLLSAVTSPFPSAALVGVGYYGLQVGGAFLAGCILARSQRIDSYLQAASIGAIAVASLAALQYLMPHGPLQHLLGPVFTSNSGDIGAVRALPIRVSGPLAHPVSLGGYGALTLPFLLRAAVAPSPRTAMLGKTAIVMVLAAVMLSQTRAAILAVPVVVVVWLAVTDRRREVLRIAVVTGVVFTLVFGASVLSSQGSVISKVIAFSGGSSGSSGQLANLSARTSLYSTGWAAFRARPVTGYGMRVPTEHAQSSVFLQFGQALAFESYVVVLPLEVGIAGVVLFLGFILTLARCVHRSCPRRVDRATVYAAIAGGTILALGSNPFDTEVTYMWLMLGLIVGCGISRRRVSELRGSGELSAGDGSVPAK